LIIAVVAELAIALWWQSDTDDNWHLWHDGIPIDAEVVGLADRFLLPADLEVQFEWEGVEQTRTIPPLFIPFPPYWFQTWDSDMVGQQVTILLNPEKPETVRLEEQGRIHPWALPLTLAGFVAVGAAAAAWNRNREGRRAVNSGNWVAHQVEMQRSPLPLVPVLEKTDTSVRVRRAKHDLDQAPGWVARHKNTVVAVHGPTASGEVAKLRWRQARDKHLLSPPTPEQQGGVGATVIEADTSSK
jgi:hypothetical protein